MRNRIFTNSFRVIYKNFTRFLSLIIMSMLGVFVFIGLQSTSPDMIKTLDTFLDNQNTYDIKILSTLGLTKDDVTYLNNFDSIENIEGVHTKDVLTTINDESIVIQILSIPENINKISLLSGKLPENKGEIVVEENLLKNYNLNINDEISFDDNFSSKTFKIVGTIDSPLYYNSVKTNPNRGSTSIGSGTINYYSYILEDEFKEDYYTNIYITVKDAKEEITSSKNYINIINNTKEEIKNIKTLREDLRYQNIYDEAKEEIEKEKKEAYKKLNNAKKKLDNGYSKLKSAKKTLDSAKKSLNTFKTNLDNAKKEIENGKKKYNETIINYNIKENEINENITNLENLITTLNTYIKSIEETDNNYIILKTQLEDAYKKLELLKQIKVTKEKIKTSEEVYKQNLEKYNSLNKEYNDNYNLYKKNINEYEKNLKKYKNNKKDVDKKIEDAYSELDKLEHPTWYVYDRSDYNTYTEYVDDTNSINNLSTIFPVVFFAVAILVSLISMNRMVEDDRNEIGTLKSLGFNNLRIMSKYLLFSISSTLIGSILGSILGNIIIPSIIFNIYKILFDVPELIITWNFKTIILGFLISCICICGTTIFTTKKVLKEKPSELMRPKAPKSGKRVFLERIPLIWNKMNFSNKVTIRNLFRYKKRVIATIIGVSGCCALILCGFGIKDAIVDIVDMQYGKTFKYDALTYTKQLTNDEIKDIFNSEKIKYYTQIMNLNATYEKTNINLFITKTEDDLNKVVNLKNKKGEKITLENNKVIITDKFADIKHLKIGDFIDITDINGKTYTFTISEITKNYLGHYIYLSKDTFEKAGGKIEENIVYLNLSDINESEKQELTNKILEDDKIINITYIDTLKESASNMLKSLDKVVIILILLASCLSFVVLYNLSNINIHERKREIATLKVLGFYSKEVDNYITKENILLTFIGIILGLILGYFLTTTVIISVEIEKARFIQNISIYSYLYAAIISCIFTFIINIITHFILKKIDMISSLKSVE